MRPAIFFLLLAASFAKASAPSPEATVYKALEGDTKQPFCAKSLGELSEFRLLFALPGFSEFASSGKAPAPFTGALAQWSTDLMLRVVFQIEQDYGGRCPLSPRLRALSALIKNAYLAKLGVSAEGLGPEESEQVFRGFLMLGDDVPKLKARAQRLGHLKADEILKRLYGDARVVRGVTVVALNRELVSKLEKLVDEVCGRSRLARSFKKTGDCLFWHPLVLYKVVITDEKGVAAYLPELSELVVSEGLVNEDNLLNKIVFLHELAHVAERAVSVTEGISWRDEFSAFSGWRESQGKWTAPVDTLPNVRSDELTRESAGSPFSILPDPVCLGGKNGTNSLDGFVMAKSYRASLERGDPSEDLADHIAVFRYAPERYCFEGKAIAPHKWRWVAEHAFPHLERKKLSCKPD